MHHWFGCCAADVPRSDNPPNRLSNVSAKASMKSWYMSTGDRPQNSGSSSHPSDRHSLFLQQVLHTGWSTGVPAPQHHRRLLALGARHGGSLPVHLLVCVKNVRVPLPNVDNPGGQGDLAGVSNVATSGVETHDRLRMGWHDELSADPALTQAPGTAAPSPVGTPTHLHVKPGSFHLAEEAFVGTEIVLARACSAACALHVAAPRAAASHHRRPTLAPHTHQHAHRCPTRHPP